MRKIVRYFTKKKRGLSYIPRQYIRSYNILDATEEQERIMKAGAARSPQEAQRLLDYYGVARAAELLPLLPKKERGLLERVWRRLVWLIMKIEGARFTTKERYSEDRLPVYYDYES